MSQIGFEPFPKIGRLTRECVITEKIDGTNAQVNIVVLPDNEVMPTETPIIATGVNPNDPGGQHTLLMYAGSRTRYITPEADNMGFAAWVKANAEELFTLGPGRHFGEWWGGKIQRGYGRTDKQFSLFNTSRWVERDRPRLVPLEGPAADKQEWAPTCCRVVPELYRGLFGDRIVDNMLAKLKAEGSVAAPGFMQPEGVVVFHTATGVLFKKLIENDDKAKGQVAA